MKKTIRCLSIVVTVTLLALPVFANGVSPRAGEAVQEPCSADVKLALYGEFYKELKGDQAKAYEAAKKYVACPTDANDAAEVTRINYLKGFITKYEKQDRFTRLSKLMIDKKYADAFPVGKDILNDQPDNPAVTLDLVFAGYASGNAAFDADTLMYAKKAIQLLESGKVPDKWERFQSKDDALAYSNYIVAVKLSAKNSPSEAIPYFIKAASYESAIKKLPITYASLGEAYEKGPFAKQSAEYKEKFGGKDESPEQKLALENVNQIVDRMIDAYARAVAIAGNDPQHKDIKTQALAGATEWYKYRNNGKEAGLDTMIASILSKPLPPEPTPLTSLPTPAATPSGPGTSATGTAPAGGNGTVGTPAKSTATSTPVKTGGPTKPKMRAHAQP
jgi:hypothetical protein